MEIRRVLWPIEMNKKSTVTKRREKVSMKDFTSKDLLPPFEVKFWIRASKHHTKLLPRHQTIVPIECWFYATYPCQRTLILTGFLGVFFVRLWVWSYHGAFRKNPAVMSHGFPVSWLWDMIVNSILNMGYLLKRVWYRLFTGVDYVGHVGLFRLYVALSLFGT